MARRVFMNTVDADGQVVEQFDSVAHAEKWIADHLTESQVRWAYEDTGVNPALPLHIESADTVWA